MSEKQPNGKGVVRINNTQRKALVDLAEQKFQRLIQKARDDDRQLINQIEEQVRKELGVTAISQEIRQLEQRQKFLEKAREKLGFGEYGSAIAGTKAQKLIDQRTSNTSKRELGLTKSKDEAIAKLWTSQTIQEAEGILQSVPSGGASK